MSDRGHNNEALLKRHAETIRALMDQINDMKDEVKTELKAAKSSGLDTKALSKIVREMLMDKDGMEKQLSFELEVDLYRRAVGLPVELNGTRAG